MCDLSWRPRPRFYLCEGDVSPSAATVEEAQGRRSGRTQRLRAWSGLLVCDKRRPSHRYAFFRRTLSDTERWQVSFPLTNADRNLTAPVTEAPVSSVLPAAESPLVPPGLLQKEKELNVPPKCGAE